MAHVMHDVYTNRCAPVNGVHGGFTRFFANLMFATMNKAERAAADREAFAAALKLRDMTQADLAARMGMTRQAINNWGGIVRDRYVLQVSIILKVPAEKLRPGLVDETRERLAKYKAAA